MTLIITNILVGSTNIKEYRGKLQYAKVEDIRGNLVCSATLEYILKAYYERKEQICNYKEALFEYIEFYDNLIKTI
jgi:hypothetical protein